MTPLPIIILTLTMLLALGLGAWLIHRLITKPGTHMMPRGDGGEGAVPDRDLPDLWDGQNPWPLEPGDDAPGRNAGPNGPHPRKGPHAR